MTAPGIAGPGATRLAVGDEVFGRTATGAYATHAPADADKLVHRPPTLGRAAAALTTGTETALRCSSHLALEPGETLLCHAAAGGVGTPALPLAAARGTRVLGTASEHNHASVRQLGAEPVRRREGLVERARERAPHGVDAAIDAARRGGALEASIALTGGTERVVSLVSGCGAEQHGVHFSGGGDWSFAEPLAEATALDQSGAGLRMPVHRMYPLAEAAEAMRESERGRVRGKVVLVVG